MNYNSRMETSYCHCFLSFIVTWVGLNVNFIPVTDAALTDAALTDVRVDTVIIRFVQLRMN